MYFDMTDNTDKYLYLDDIKSSRQNFKTVFAGMEIP